MRILVSILLICLLGGSFLVVWQLQDLTQAIGAVAIGFVINTVAALFAVMVGLSRLEQFLLRTGNAREFGPLADFWSVPAPTKNWYVVFGGKPSNDASDPELRVSFSTVFAFSQISAILKQLYGAETSITLKNFRDIEQWDAVASSNVIFLGGVVSIPKIKEIFALLPLHAKQQVLESGERQIIISDGYADTILPSKVQDTLVIEDHALVTRIINSHNRSAYFTISGGWGAGTGAAALALTSKAHFNSTGFVKEASFNEVVISAKDIVGGQIYRGEPTVDCRTWRHDGITKQVLSQVTRKLCE